MLSSIRSKVTKHWLCSFHSKKVVKHSYITSLLRSFLSKILQKFKVHYFLFDGDLLSNKVILYAEKDHLHICSIKAFNQQGINSGTQFICSKQKVLAHSNREIYDNYRGSDKGGKGIFHKITGPCLQKRHISKKSVHTSIHRRRKGKKKGQSKRIIVTIG